MTAAVTAEEAMQSGGEPDRLGLGSRLAHLVTSDHGGPKGSGFLMCGVGYERKDLVRFRDNVWQIPCQE